jgi:two-component system chemotaxis sensor kinase CheA
VSVGGFDNSILQDFLTECGELLEQLEADLVVLEGSPSDPEMLNQVFRALHTIKGSASFLGLTNLVGIAHCSESALNAARNSVVRVDRAMMDLLLRAVDIIKKQMGQLGAGDELVVPPKDLVDALTRLGEGKQSGGAKAAATATPAPATAAAAKPESTPAPAAGSSSSIPAIAPLSLAPGKAELLEFLIADLDESLGKIAERVGGCAGASPDDAAVFRDLCDALKRAVDFFEFGAMSELCAGLAEYAANAQSMPPEACVQAAPRVMGALELMKLQAAGLRQQQLLTWPTRTLMARLHTLCAGGSLAVGETLPAGVDAVGALAFDGAGGPGAKEAAAEIPAQPPAPIDVPEPVAEPADRVPASTPPESKPDEEKGARDEHGKKHGAGVEQTIRVEVGRLETLMNLVGELVLQKNRLAAISRSIAGETSTATTLKESMTLAAGGLDRVTADIQLAVMRTRMQPLDKLFGRYPRLIRDLSTKTGKKIDLVIEGGETEVDKSVIEELGDPLVHLLRNSADHGVETIADRVASGKSETGTIKLSASHEGSHVRLQIADDGRGLNRDRIARKAIERGLVREADVSGMPDRQVFDFIFLPGFSTAEQVSDLSGRGVGMDVVRTNIEKLKGTIDLASTAGQGTTITITIPLTVAILPAMMVGVANEIYAIPLTNILEIVRPSENEVSTIGEHPVMRLRDSVLPLIRAAELFGHPEGGSVSSPFAVVLSMGQRRCGLLVTRLIGQQEIVIKPLDGRADHGGPVSGATVRDDGGVSLIVDVGELLRLAEGRQAGSAA